ncbi:MAG: RDD family protein [Candidatus Schekmanbacteria bacterium]|nr:RDD family protein [Candidatus Schekmanbacteria bacterium]
MELTCTNCGKINHPQLAFCLICGTKLAKSPSPKPVFKAQAFDTNNPAGFFKRLSAFVLDQMILLCIGLAFGSLLSLALIKSGGQECIAYVMTKAFGVLAGWAYYTSLETCLQATFGKLALGLAVTDLAGQPISFLRANVRYFGKILSAIVMGLGFLAIATSRKKQGWHDKLAGCLVLEKG